MKERLLQFLACPECAGAIEFGSVSERDGGEILTGELVCSSAAHRFPITRGVPRFRSLDQVEEDKAATAANFGWQ